MVVSNPTVFIVDSDAAFSSDLSALLHATGLTTAAFVCPLDYLAQFDVDAPGVIVSETRFSQISGAHFQAVLATKPRHPPLIFATHYPDILSARRLLRTGAFDYLPKTAGESELYDSIQQALGQDQQQRAEFDTKRSVLARYAHLRETDHAVLDLILAGEVNKHIATALGLSRRTIEDRRARIMEKLQVESLAEMVAMITQARLWMKETASTEHPIRQSEPRIRQRQDTGTTLVLG